MISPLGLKVWQGQCTLISRPRLVSGGRWRIEWSKPVFSLPRFLLFGPIWCKERNFWGLSLTSVHEPLPHCLRHIKGDPFRRPFGQDVLAPNVALFGFGVVFLQDLCGKMKMWPSCINFIFSHTHTLAEPRLSVWARLSRMPWAKCLLFMEKVTPRVDIPILQVNACVLPSCQWKAGCPSPPPLKRWLKPLAFVVPEFRKHLTQILCQHHK